MPKNLTRRQALVLPVGIALGSFASRYAMAADPIKVGLVAALSGQSAKSGEGITRGLTIAIDEINVGCGDEYHPQRRQSKLRFPSFSGRRAGGSRIDQARNGALRCENTGADAGQ